ncbi:MAG TPA: lycopene cyclase domain-containing protein [Bdellovibrionales bacterium]|nr:lycopene cyclase domain-containing protein [Bdellovibrionales bacterium]
MTYFQFHLLFILPPIFILALLRPIRGELARKRAGLGLVFICALAMVYTTPWDNYLVYKGVWQYGEDRVMGTIGYVPVEEYLFFILQSIMTGLLFCRLARAMPFEGKPAPNWIGTAFWSAVTLAGVACLFFERTLYAGLILAWAPPVLALQWGVGGSEFSQNKRLYAAAVGLPTIYLWIADALAIHWGIWSISTDYTVGLKVGSLPVEEAIFFLMTNLLVVQGLWLFLKRESILKVGAITKRQSGYFRESSARR